jgi:hypothetical protein
MHLRGRFNEAVRTQSTTCARPPASISVELPVRRLSEPYDGRRTFSRSSSDSGLMRWASNIRSSVSGLLATIGGARQGHQLRQRALRPETKQLCQFRVSRGDSRDIRARTNRACQLACARAYYSGRRLSFRPGRARYVVCRLGTFLSCGCAERTPVAH